MSRATFPSKESRELYVELANVLESFGITEYDLGKGGIHPYIIFKVKDQTYKYPFPGTGSDWRGAKNARATLINKLREMNLTPIAKDEPPAPEPAEERLAPADAFAEQDEIIVATAPVEQKEAEKAPEQPEVRPEPPVVEQPPEPPLRDAGAAVWEDETLVQFAANQGLLYLSLPQHPVMVFELDVDLVAEKGSKLIVDPVVQKVRVIPKNMIDLMYQPLPKETSLREAMKLVMRGAPTRPEPPQRQEPQRPQRQERTEPRTPKVEDPPEVVDEPPPKRRFKGSVHGLGLMLGRVLVALDYIQHTYRTDKVETSQIVEVLDKDKPGSIASQVSFAVTKKLIYVVGPIPGRRGNYYRLTELGRRKARQVGKEPFTLVGMKPPSQIAMAAE